MHELFKKILVSPSALKSLRFEGTWLNGYWDDGILSDDTNKYPVRKGIPCFALEEDQWKPGGNYAEQYKSKKDEGKIESCIQKSLDYTDENWESLPKEYEFIKGKDFSGKLIIEIACGPGGGLSSLILKEYPEAIILMNDFGLFIVQGWSSISQKKGLWTNLSFSQFDARHCPIMSDSIDCVTSDIGFSEIASNIIAFREAYRMLKPGGMLYAVEYDYDMKASVKIPDDILVRLEEEYPRDPLYRDPYFGKGYKPRLFDAGFKDIVVDEIKRWPVEPKPNSKLGELFALCGIEMSRVIYRIFARK
jgi:ubiquinone/menaquinone biosynthesis C-methylase UbiE